MGKTGEAVSAFLSVSAIDHICCDDSADYVACDNEVLNKQGFIFKSPGLRPEKFRDLAADNQVVNDVELLLRMTLKPVILVTGTNGKSTLVELLEAILIANGIDSIACGNNGVPVLQAYQKKPAVYIIELSSYQLENLSSQRSLAATVLNVGVDHVDRYGGMDEYQRVKESIYQTARNVVLPVNESGEVCYDDEIVGYKTGQTIYHLKENLLYRNEREYCALSQIALLGKHNYLNICAALALLDVIRLDDQQVVQTLNSFKGLPHRMELVCEDFQGRAWVNDSKSTNVHSTRAALGSMPVPVTLIMGGRGKGEDYSELLNQNVDRIAVLIVYGEDAGLIYSQADAIEKKHQIVTVSEAVRLADKYDSSVLFSPACASFDQYQNFNERGDDFKRQIDKVVIC